MNQAEHLYRFKTIRFATGCLLAYAVFRYLAELKASPSLVIVFYYGIFYLIGGLIFAYTEDVDADLGGDREPRVAAVATEARGMDLPSHSVVGSEVRERAPLRPEQTREKTQRASAGDNA